MTESTHHNPSLAPPLDNPLMVDINTTLDYAAIKPEHIEPAIEYLIAQTRRAIEQVAAQSTLRGYHDVVSPIDDASAPLWRAWSVVGHLNAVVNTPELRQAYNNMIGPISDLSTWIGLHEGLFEQYQKLAARPDFSAWRADHKRVVHKALDDFRLSGVQLKGQARQRYAQISEAQAKTSQEFAEHVLDANDAWSLTIDDVSLLDGLPADVLHAAQARSGQADRYVLNLKMPCYLPVMQYATHRDLRGQMYRAYATLASDQGDPKFDNSALIESSLALRTEQAQLLGFSDYAALRLQTRMANDANEVLTFMRDLAKRAKPFAMKDLETLKAFAKAHCEIDDLQPWDVAFVSERLRQSEYDYSEDEVKQYFTQTNVLTGLFDIVQQVFQVRLLPATVSAWHPDVQAFDVADVNGGFLGQLIIDLPARTGKQGGAWVNDERNRRKTQTGVTTPIVYLTCNFAQGQDGQDALLTHDDVITLFHEMGHALHALLSEVDEPSVSAFAAVEWDAIELPSQFMENFCWQPIALKRLSAHCQTGEPLPDALIAKLIAAKNFQSGMQTVRQIEFALFDMLLHQSGQALDVAGVMQTLEAVRDEVAVIKPPHWHRFPHAFTHLFAGGYGAGYYSYKWAEVLSSDAFEAFEQAPHPLDPETGMRFRKEILAVGGMRPAAESFVAFRGRKPSLNALLRHQGMHETSLEH